eukprot:8315595-Pyramimonas_sp.AAC.1
MIDANARVGSLVSVSVAQMGFTRDQDWTGELFHKTCVASGLNVTNTWVADSSGFTFQGTDGERQ